MINKTWLMRLKKQSPILVFFGSLAMLTPVAAYAEVAGQVQFVAGDVRIVDAAGNQRVAQKGQNISEGETVITAAGSSAQLRMIDGGILALRPETQIKVDTYVFKGKEDGSENALLSLVKGGLRTITGLIGHENKEKLKLRTPTATIGIRGTDHEPIVLIEPPAGSPPPPNPPGTYDKVNVGATSLTTNVGTALVNPNQVGFAASLNQAPVLLPKLPDFYRATPSPVAHAAQHQGQASSTQSTVQSNAEPSSEAGSASSSSESKTDTTTAVAAAPAAELTGVNSSGATINLANQTLTSSSGQVVSLSNASSSNSGGSSSGGSTGGSSSGGTGTGGTTAPNVGNVLVLSFPYTATSGTSSGTAPFYLSFSSGLSLSKDATGNLTGVSLSSNSDFTANGNSFDLAGIASLNQSGSTLTNFGSDSTTGISWGRWQGGTVTAGETGGGQAFTTNLGAGSLHWITGPGASPNYLPQVLTGSATYNLIGGTNPTDMNGTVGTLNTATLAVNFSTQTANANLGFTIGGNSWGMQSGNMTLDGTQFSSTNCAVTSSTCTGALTITKNGAVTSATPTATSTSYSIGSIQGFLTGSGLNGAALEYSIDDFNISSSSTSTSSNNVIQGVAALSGPTQNIATPFRAVGTTDGWNNLSNIVNNNSSISSGGSSSGVVYNYSPSYRGSVSGGEQSVASVVDSSSGLTSFVGQAAGYTAAANSSVSVPTAGTGGPLVTINVGTASNTDLGSTTVDGVTVSWGRWAGGTVNIYSLDGSTLMGTIDNSNRSIHWITTSSLNNTSFNLPTSGTATYTLAGNTSPTDYRGNTGTLNSVTLNADFGNAKVNTTINVSFNASNNTSTWMLTANNMPLGGSNAAGFSSDSAQNGVNGITNTVTCTGTSCGTNNHDYVQGHFIAGAQGAVIFYGMSSGTNTTSTSSSGTSVTTYTPSVGNTGLVVMTGNVASSTSAPPSVSDFTPIHGISGPAAIRR
jgi:hypothetical protein